MICGELFVGAGGLGLGISKAGFQHVFLVEADKSACNTLAVNRLGNTPESFHWPVVDPVDVRSQDFKSFEGRVDLLSAGPPCQPFSLGGKHLGDRDPRDMFPETLRAIREIKPKAILIENVSGILRDSFATYFEYILLQLRFPSIARAHNEPWLDHLAKLERHSTSRAGSRNPEYNVVFRKLNAANFGVPQRRERVFLIAFRSDIEYSWSFPEETHSAEALISRLAGSDYWDAHRIELSKRQAARSLLRITDDRLPGLEKDGLLPWKTLRDAISDLPKPLQFDDQGISNHLLVPGARSYVGHTGCILDWPAKTLKAGSHGVPGGENTIINDDESLRYFTIREAARLQGFPDTYVFPGPWTTVMRQLGNAVPVPLSQAIAGSIAQSLQMHCRMNNHA